MYHRYLPIKQRRPTSFNFSIKHFASFCNKYLYHVVFIINETAMITSDFSQTFGRVQFKWSPILFMYSSSCFSPPPPPLLFLDFNICLLTHKRIQTRSVSSKWVPARLTERAWELGDKRHPLFNISHRSWKSKLLFWKVGQNWGISFHQGQFKCQKIIYK